MASVKGKLAPLLRFAVLPAAAGSAGALCASFPCCCCLVSACQAGLGLVVPVGTWRAWLARGSSPGADEARAFLITMRMDRMEEPCGSNSLQISPPSVQIRKHFQTFVPQIDHINTPRSCCPRRHALCYGHLD